MPPGPLLCKVSWIFGFSVFDKFVSVCLPYWTPIGPLLDPYPWKLPIAKQKKHCQVQVAMCKYYVGNCLHRGGWVRRQRSNKLVAHHYKFEHLLQKNWKTAQKLKNRNFNKPYINVVREASIWDSGWWEWWGIVLGRIPIDFRDIWPYKTSETCSVLLISQYLFLGGSKKCQWSPHFYNQSIPWQFPSKPRRKVSACELSVSDR